MLESACVGAARVIAGGLQRSGIRCADLLVVAGSGSWVPRIGPSGHCFAPYPAPTTSPTVSLNRQQVELHLSPRPDARQHSAYKMWSPTPPRCGDLRLTLSYAEVTGGRQHPTTGSWRVSAVCVGELGVDAPAAPVWGRLGAFGGLFRPVMRSGGALAGWCGAVVWFSGTAKPTALRRRLLSGGVVPC